MARNDTQSGQIESVQDYLTYPVRVPSDVDVLFRFLRTYFEGLLNRQYNTAIVANVEPVTDRFLTAVGRFMELDEDTLGRLKNLAEELLNVSLGFLADDHVHDSSSFSSFVLRATRSVLAGNPRRRSWERTFHLSTRLHTALVEVYNRFSVSQSASAHHLDLYDFFLPDLSDKQSAAALIQEAISILEKDETLSISARKRIVVHLRRAIDEIEKPKSDWATFFGNMKEVVIVLGAVGSMVGGYCALRTACEKIEEATRVIERTSINVNYVSVAYNQLTEQNVRLALPAAQDYMPAAIPASSSATGDGESDSQQASEPR